jgi:hypothetical protein
MGACECDPWEADRREREGGCLTRAGRPQWREDPRTPLTCIAMASPESSHREAPIGADSGPLFPSPDVDSTVLHSAPTSSVLLPRGGRGHDEASVGDHRSRRWHVRPSGSDGRGGRLADRFWRSAPSANDRIARAVTPTVENRFGYTDLSCSIVGSTDRLFKCAANGQSIGLFLLESDGVVDRISTR